MTQPASLREVDPASTDLATLAAEGRPAVLRGFVKDWPLLDAAARSAEEAGAMLAQFDSGKPATAMQAPAGEGGAYFYTPDMRGFNFTQEKTPLGEVARRVLALRELADAPTLYAGSVDTAEHLPGFESAHPLPHGFEKAGGRSRIWLGTASTVATHMDMTPNIAVCVTGPRAFTVFPPEATGDLYVGPLHMTPAGPPVSMVDPASPDLQRYPRFARAAKLALRAELQPGDAIYIPALWWHHVVAREDFNILVNFWHDPVAHGNPFPAFVHALWSIRDLPEPHRRAWRHWFDHFVFGADAHAAADHLPEAVRLINGPPSARRDEAMRGFLMRTLSTGQDQ
ncbi:MAG: cupin-like domain-containing protein [Alteraurantiacibacter sp.]